MKSPAAHEGPFGTAATDPGKQHRDAELEALRREVERLRVLASKDRGVLDAILEHSPHGIIVCDVNGKLVLQNRAAERIWAGSATAENREQWRKYRAFRADGTPFPAEDWALGTCLRTRQVVETRELRIQRFDDSFGFLLSGTAPILGPDGALEGAITVFADISAMKDTEAAANELHRRFDRQRVRLSVLARSGEALAATLDARSALAAFSRCLTPDLSDFCALDVRSDEGLVERVALAHADPRKLAEAVRLESDHAGPFAHAAREARRTGRLYFQPELPDAANAENGEDAEALALAHALGLRSVLSLPLTYHGRMLGTLTLASESPRVLSSEDVELGEELARRAALSLAHARLYQEAEAARKQLARLISSAPAAIAVAKGKDQKIQLANEPYERLVARRKVVGKTLRDVMPDGAHEALSALVQEAYDTDSTLVATELPVVSPEGDSRESGYFNVVCQPTHDPSGVVTGTATFAFDVTSQVLDRQRLEALASELARSEGRLRTLVEATATVVWTATAEGEVVEVSPSWLAFTGQTAKEYLRDGFADAIHPDDRELTMEIWRIAVQSGAAFAAEYRLRKRDGGYAHTLARGMPVRGADGSIVEYVGCNVDVSELRRAEAAAREHADTVATISELGKVIASEFDVQKVVQAVTDAATQRTGAQFGAFFYNVNDDAGGKYMLYTLSGVDKKHFAKFPNPRNTVLFAPTFAGESIVRVDDVTKDPRYGKNAPLRGMPEGHLPVKSYLAVPVISRSGEVLGAILLGHGRPGVFTERAETLGAGFAAQAAIAMDNARLFGDAQRLIRELAASNKELDEFAYVTSHDLKAPLRGIASLAEWIEEDLGPRADDETRRKLHLMRGRVRRMEALIQGILDYSRAGRTSERDEEVDVQKLVQDVIELLNPQPDARVVIDTALPVLVTQRVALEQVLMNLIGNALKHAGRKDPVVRIACLAGEDAMEFRISDNGPGIAPAFHERVWGIFQTLEARDKVENTGIGLAIVRKVVESRKGKVWIVSEEGRGATFAFTWPDPLGRLA